MDRLVTLDLSYNFIRKLENLAPLPALENLVCAGNALSDTADVEELRGCRALVSLDLSDNKLSEPGGESRGGCTLLSCLIFVIRRSC